MYNYATSLEYAATDVNYTGARTVRSRLPTAMDTNRPGCPGDP